MSARYSPLAKRREILSQSERKGYNDDGIDADAGDS